MKTVSTITKKPTQRNQYKENDNKANDNRGKNNEENNNDNAELKTTIMKKQ